MGRSGKVMMRLGMLDCLSMKGSIYNQTLTRNSYGQLTERVVFVSNPNYGNDETYAIPA